jgi:hypothetical protein
MAKLKKAQNGLAVAVKKAAPYYKTAKAKDAQAKAGDAKLKELEAKEQAGMGAVDRLIRQPKIEADSARKTGDSLVVAGLTPRSLKKKKMGGMIKRADGSMSKRGLWDNIRANKGSGKKPTAQMLKQEKKIKAQSKKK